ncbi:hypothetical protein EOD39_4852 [Acipenser ruthenus]|uniref:Uncharacterized protein n=1 Tax=Acipenser ruthenus TaxID=7906 RepID=A0A444UGI3_ACIRT|nr:hypothetical protein EOD39_4852 [Acipenser ruthenus]
MGQLGITAKDLGAADLSEQNQVLIQTLEELETGSEQRVNSLERELEEYACRLKENDQEKRTLRSTQESLEQDIYDLRTRLDLTKEELLCVKTSAVSVVVLMLFHQISAPILGSVPDANGTPFGNHGNNPQHPVWHSEETISQLRRELLEFGSATCSGALVLSVSDAQAFSFQELQGTSFRGTELLKSELARRDAAIQNLQKDVLLSHQALSAEVISIAECKEQRISRLQTELQESQAELQHGQGRIQQLNRDLQTTGQQCEELRTQLTEVKEQLARGEEENEALRNCKLELTAEVDMEDKQRAGQVERLSATVCSMNQEVGERGGVLTGQADQQCQELESQLSETRVQLRQCQDTVRALRD